MRINLHLTRIFHAVVLHGGFSRGAAHLHISQSAASKAVRELETQLGLPLIERGGMRLKGVSGVQLTQPGQSLYEHARSIFALEQAALDDLQARGDLRKGQLAIGASTTVAAYWLPPYMAEFARRFPQVNIQVIVGNTSLITQGLLDCRMDLAVVEGGVHDEAIEVAPWRQEPLVVVARPGSVPVAEAGEDMATLLSASTWLVREAGSGTRDVAQMLLSQRGIHPARTLEMGSNESIARAVAQGLGLALLPQAVVQDLLRLEQLAVVPCGGEFERPLYRMQRAHRLLGPAALAFAELLAQAPETGFSDAYRSGGRAIR